MTAPLARIEEARRLLAEANTVDDVKGIRDLAEQARLYARQKGLSIDAMNQASELKVRAERRMGELLRAMPKNQGGWESRNSKEESQDSPPRLRDIGITPKQSMIYQQLAGVPEPAFELAIDAVKDEERPISARTVIRKSGEPVLADVSDQIDWSALPPLKASPGERAGSRLSEMTGIARTFTPAEIAATYREPTDVTVERFERFGDWLSTFTDELRRRVAQPVRAVT